MFRVYVGNCIFSDVLIRLLPAHIPKKLLQILNIDAIHYIKAKILKILINKAMLVDDEKTEMLNSIEKTFIFNENMLK